MCAIYADDDTCEGLFTLVHIMKRTLVLLVERTIATAAAERMRLGVTLTKVGHQKGDGTHSKRTHPKEDVPIEIGRKSDHQWVSLLHGFF